MIVASPSRPRAFLRSFPTILVAGACALASSAQSVKLSGALAQPIGGNVSYSLTTPDGSYVVYRADQEIDERHELYRVPSDGSQPPVKISDPLHGDVLLPRGLITPDGAAVLYLTDGPTLFRAPLDGGSAPVALASGIALDVDLLSHEDPFRIDISPDGQWAVYRENDPAQLQAVRVDGSAPPIPIGVAANVIPKDFRISPDGQRVVFRAGISEIKHALYSAPIDGSASPTRLNPGYFDARQTVGGFQISPDSQRVVYGADQDVPEVYEVYSVPIGGGVSTGLNGTLPAHADAYLEHITPDSTRVLFRVDLVANERYDLFIIPIDASAAPLRLGANHPSIWPSGILWTRLLPDGSRVVYLTSGREIYSAPLDGSTFVRLSHPEAVVTGFEVAAGGHVVFEAYLEGSAVTDLFTVPANGGYRGRAARAPRIRRLVAGVFSFSLHPDGTTVLYLDNPTGFFSISASGDAPPVELYPAYVNYGVAPGDRAFFSPLWLPEFPGAELFSVPLTGGPAVRLNTQLPLGPVVGRIRDFLVSPDHEWTVYLAEGEIWNKFELYVAPTDGSLPAVRISNPGRFHGDVGGHEPQPGGFRITPDSTRVVYFADHETPGIDDLYVVPIDGSSPATNLTEFTASTDVRHGFELTPDGEHAVFLAVVPTGPKSSSVRLHSIRLDGTPAVVLSGAPLVRANGPDAERMWSLLEVLGVVGAGAPARTWTLGIAPDRALVRTLVSGWAAAGDGALALPPLDAADFARVPADATFARLFQLRPRTLLALAESLDPDAGLDAGAGQSAGAALRPLLGADLGELLALFGPTAGAFASLSTGGGGLASGVAFVETVDSTGVEALLERLADLAQAAAEGPARGRIAVRTWEHAGTRARTLVFPGLPVPLELSLAVHADALWIALRPNALVAALEARARGGSLLDHPRLASLVAERPTDAVSFGFFDAPPYLERGYGSASTLCAALANALRSPYDPAREPGSILPPFAALRTGARASVSWSRLVGDDLVGTTSFDRSFAANATVALGTPISSLYGSTLGLGLVSSIAIPKLMSARLSANEAAAIASLRALASAQAQLGATAAIDEDRDGVGEYGFLGELAGARALRGRRERLEPPVLSSAFAALQDDGDGDGVVQRSGYWFQVWLPARSGAAVAERQIPSAAVKVHPDAAERAWCAYAWPVEPGSTGLRAFFVNQEGELFAFDNQGGVFGGLQGSGGRQPAFDSALSRPDLQAAPARGRRAADGALWRPLE